MNFNLLFGLGLILIDVIVKMATFKIGMDFHQNLGFLYVGILNVIAGIVLTKTPSLIFKLIVGSTMSLGILYPMFRVLHGLGFGGKGINLMGYLGLWFMATGIIFLIFTPTKDE